MRVNEIFYSIQGEGAHAGTPAIFIRFSGCNLKCPFCDTDFSSYKEMTEDEIIDAMRQLTDKCHNVVITGGEPTLQIDSVFVAKLHINGYIVAMESNGTRKAPKNLDWLTISPKEPFVGSTGKLYINSCHELKLVFDGEHEPSDFGIKAEHYYLQPCDTGDKAKNDEIINKLIEYVKKNPRWKISLQTQKILSVR